MKNIVNHTKIFLRGVRGIFSTRYTDVPFDRIVVIVGIKSSSRYMDGFIKFLQKHFPDKEIILIQDFYFYQQSDKVEAMIGRSVEALSSEKKTLIFAHSFGGMIARAAIARLENMEHVVLLATLGSPHGIEDFGMREVIAAHRIPDTCTVPVMTFGGRVDPVVPDELSCLTGEVAHITLSCTHTAFIKISRTRKEVLSAVMQHLAQKK